MLILSIKQDFQNILPLIRYNNISKSNPYLNDSKQLRDSLDIKVSKDLCLHLFYFLNKILRVYLLVKLLCISVFQRWIKLKIIFIFYLFFFFYKFKIILFFYIFKIIIKIYYFSLLHLNYFSFKKQKKKFFFKHFIIIIFQFIFCIF
jgi:hypothetical protein